LLAPADKIRGHAVEDIIGLITLYAFAAVAPLLPLYVIVRSIINLGGSSGGRRTILIKALVVLGVWLMISLIFAFIPIMYVFEPWRGVDNATASRRITIISISLTIIYIILGLAMAYRVSLQPGWKTIRKAHAQT
jgi:hypothetical protein